VLATLAAPPGGPPRVRRADFEAFEGLLGKLGDSRVAMVTGEAGDKAAVAIGIATTAVATGRRAALVECDLTAPALAEAVGLAIAPGLHEYLLGDADAPQILQSAVLAGPKSQGAAAPLVCVAAGRPAADGTALLASDGFRHAISKLRHAYELVVLDGPPLGSDGEALRAVADQADATLASARNSKVPRKPPVRIDGLVSIVATA
jgi:Mrp family chromosome partitioning ATPase